MACDEIKKSQINRRREDKRLEERVVVEVKFEERRGFKSTSLGRAERYDKLAD